MAGELAPLQSAIPIVASASDRETRYPPSARIQNQRVFRLDTGNQERWTGSSWVIDFQGATSVLPPGGSRTVSSATSYLANNATFNVLDYGADATGGASSNAALTKILTDMTAGMHAVINFPAGTYLIQNFDGSGFSNTIFQGVPGRTTLTGGTALVASHTTPSTTSLCSRRALQFTSATAVMFQDIVFDGQQPSGPSWYQAAYTDQQAILELRSCSWVRFLRCDFINFTPAFPANTSGGLQNTNVVEDYNHGPVFLSSCTHIRRDDVRLLAPCYGEGLIGMNCVDAVESRTYSNAGYDTNATYGTSTPIHWMGPLTKDIMILAPNLYHSNGSAMQLSGLGPFRVELDVIDACGGINASLGNVGYFGGTDYDQTGLSLSIRGGTIKNLLDNPNSKIAGIDVGGRTDGGFQYQSVHIDGVTFDRCYDFIDVRGCEDVKIRGISGSRSLLAGASGGTGIFVDACSNVEVSGTTVDGSVDVGGAGATTRLQYGIIVQDCDDVRVTNNIVIDASAENYRATVSDAWDLPFSGGGTELRDQLFQLLWFGGGPITITGASSGATANFIGRNPSGNPTTWPAGWIAGTISGTIRCVVKTGTFTNGESLTIGGHTAAATATGDAVLISAMNRVSVCENHSYTITTTTTPYFIQPVNLNAMAGKNSRWGNLHNGALIDPIGVAANIGDANVTLTSQSIHTAQFLTALTADRLMIIPNSPSFVGETYIAERGVASAHNIIVQTVGGSTVFTLPPYSKGYAIIQYNAGWRCVLYAPADALPVLSNSAAPTVGTWTEGQFVFNTGAALATNLGWVCTVAGTPGTWVSFGYIGPTLAVAQGFGCNGASPQSSVSGMAALATYGTGTNGFDTAGHAQEIHDKLNIVLTALRLDGIGAP